MIPLAGEFRYTLMGLLETTGRIESNSGLYEPSSFNRF